MFEVVKDVHFTRDCLSCYNFVHLWHIARTVNLSLVINLQFNLDALIFWQVYTSLGGSCLSCCLDSLGAGTNRGTRPLVGVVKSFAVFSRIFRGLQWYLDFNDLDVVLFIVRGVGTNKKSLHSPVAIEGSSRKRGRHSYKMKTHLRIAIWHPLNCETGPGKGVRVECVIEEWGVLLPNLVLLKDALLLQLIGVVHCER
jgi:hypothetical protein